MGIGLQLRAWRIIQQDVRGLLPINVPLIILYPDMLRPAAADQAQGIDGRALGVVTAKHAVATLKPTTEILSGGGGIRR